MKSLPEFLNTHSPGKNWSVPWQGEVGAKGWVSVQAALTALVRNRSLSALLKDCVDFSGDVDTVATIALATASCSTEYAQDLPSALVSDLENGAYGRDYLQQLDQKLMSLVQTN